jgi:hypothetical protein
MASRFNGYLLLKEATKNYGRRLEILKLGMDGK